MLSALRFTNFKSWAKVDLPCGRITGVFGTNSSGKTSLIQFLLLMKQTKDATDRAVSLELNGGLVQLGTIGDTIHQHDETRSIEMALAFDLESELALSDPSQKKSAVIAKGRILTLSAEVGVQQRAVVAHRLSYQLGDLIFELAPRNGDQAQFDLKAMAANASSSNFSFLKTRGRPWPLPGPIKTYAFPDQART